MILLKPGQLSSAEFEIMKRHAIIGAEALRMAAGHTDSGSFLAMGADIAACHHERFNGSGYPHGWKGTDIPLSARIVALADVYDALTSVRVYKSAFEPIVARSMIENERGKALRSGCRRCDHACWDEFSWKCPIASRGQPHRARTGVCSVVTSPSGATPFGREAAR